MLGPFIFRVVSGFVFVLNCSAVTKRIFLLTLLLVCGPPLFAFAAELAEEHTPARKLQRGFLNVALSPLEISHELAKEKKIRSVVPSWFAGLGRGSFFTAGRMLTGVYEMGTFFIPLPAHYDPVVQPEFTWEHLEH